MEDLWAFNEREVAQAVFDCSVPIISAVGHETDTTIIDYVADLRAPTPSAAAELAVTDVREILSQLEADRMMLNRLMQRKLQDGRTEIRQRELQLRALSPMGRIRERRMRLLNMEEQLRNRMEKLLGARRHALAIYIEKLKSLSPLEKLNSGYSYITDGDGSNIRSVKQVCEGRELEITVSDGSFRAAVLGGIVEKA